MSRHFNKSIGAKALALCGAFISLSSIAVQAQPVADGSIAQPVIQAVPAKDGLSLNAALARLARSPKDLDALIDAGNAAMAMGDVDAAIGFLNRANQVAPGTPRVKAGLGSALVLSGNPFDAFPLFQEAEAAGVISPRTAIDHGLALDLVGDNVKAQQYYRQAFGSDVNDEAIRRLALSQAISGDRRGSESTLGPLLLRNDRAAWRVRAFSLAILGSAEEGVAIANSALPNDLATGIAPYLRYMPQLTPAQQAAAANFGQFPRASEIGRDDPRVALYAPSGPPRRIAMAKPGEALTPSGQPLGGRQSARGSKTSPARPALPEPTSAARPIPAPLPARTAPPEPKPSIAVFPAPPAQTVTAEPPRPVPPVAPQVVSMPSAAVAQPAPAAQLPSVSSPSVPLITSTPVTPPVSVPAKRPSLSEAFGDFERPQAAVTPAAGAVDVRRLKPNRETADGKPIVAAALKPVVPSHPSRIWVQVATGRDKRALASDWRKLTKAAEGAFKGKLSWISAWGQTNRLLAGPFETTSAANTFVSQLKKADVTGAFVWTSPAGQVVDALGGR